MLILAVEALFLFLHSFEDKETYDEDSDDDEAVAQFMAVFCYFGKQLLFAFDAGYGGKVITDGSKNQHSPQSNTEQHRVNLIYR